MANNNELTADFNLLERFKTNDNINKSCEIASNNFINNNYNQKVNLSNLKQKIYDKQANNNNNNGSNDNDSNKQSNIKLHFKLIRYMIVCSKKLKLSDIALSTATTIYHKFFQTCDISKFDLYLIATSSLYLSSKIEEEHVKLRDVINVCYNTLHKNKPPLEINDVYWKLRNSVTQCELLLVRMLSFNFCFDHPHKYLLQYLESLRHWIPLELRKKIPVPETCWHILTDILHIDILLVYRAQEIAISIIYLVLIVYGIKVPFNTIAQKTWWKVFDDRITQNKINEIILKIISIYDIEESIKWTED